MSGERSQKIQTLVTKQWKNVSTRVDRITAGVKMVIITQIQAHRLVKVSASHFTSQRFCGRSTS